MSESSASDPLSDERFRVEVTRSDRVFDGAVWDVVRERFRFGDGELVREFMQHPGAVAILAEDREGRILLIKQYRHPIGYRDWELPAGLLDVEGEAPLAAAQRELAEEADLEAADWSPLCQFFSSPGGSSEIITVFRARSLTPAALAFDRHAEESELELRWEPFDDVLAAVLEGRVRNAILANAVLNAHARR
ncbi:NUDIX domain-containing protein [Terrimesophilobacter mesophilus]|uniref:NUDIX hydrolase n=1 Tax=Terrimesophilobacter mesophilus TaxID=433647 RepID=A0A4R8V9G4_9MICO|nr:NUDIX hydrolase [Terrimesophilobacter mesophilus]TFB78976.1 NUDIX hydrolase [Terrimesophilobacter mesophilus]